MERNYRKRFWKEENAKEIPSSDEVLELEFTVMNFPSLVFVMSRQKLELFSVNIGILSTESDPILVQSTLPMKKQWETQLPIKDLNNINESYL